MYSYHTGPQLFLVIENLGRWHALEGRCCLGTLQVLELLQV